MKRFLSIVTPAYNEEPNLRVLYARLASVLNGMDWEWIVVDDHSNDQTLRAVAEIARSDRRVQGIRLARNSGSHTAIACGLGHARGQAAIVMAADLQDPPELLPRLIDEWNVGAQVVWAARGCAGPTSRLYYLLMRRLAGIQQMPPAGADFFLLDRAVIDGLRQFHEQHTSVLALIHWMGFRQATVTFEKGPRLHGRSGWTLAKKTALLIDSITAFTFAPIRFMTYTGFAIAIAGLLYAGFVIVHSITGRPVQGWASLMVAVLVLGGFQMLMMGVLGEYAWRSLNESRRRPRYLIEDAVNTTSELHTHR